MSVLPRRVELQMLLRSFAVQGSWNYETLIGTGFAFSLLPALRYFHRDDPEGLRSAAARHSALFNSHPYLVPLALGAVARLEATAVDPKLIERFQTALRGALGSVGDQLVWGAWRPTTLLLAIALVLAGVVWWVALALFLLVYNALHLYLRVWGLRAGERAGLEVGKVLREAPFQRIARRVADVGAALCGAAVVLAAVPERPDPAGLALCAVSVGAGLWVGTRARAVWGAVLTVVVVVALALGMAGNGT